mmetsp:Transcript_6568/g.11660  ORF Transcript_6568/g.11660 Transcript_6568/m.11660 type:complete len:110 (+) Transcript_6568:149-478(+)
MRSNQPALLTTSSNHPYCIRAMLYEAILFINSNLLLCFLVTQLQLLQGPIAILVGSTSRGMNAKNCYQLTAALMLNRERVYCCVLRHSVVSHHVATADSHVLSQGQYCS